jgi:hypothetical protein
VCATKGTEAQPPTRTPGGAFEVAV